MSYLSTYHHHLEQVQKLVSRMYADLEKYAEKEAANETYISIQNEVLKTIIGFINISEKVMNEAQKDWIPLEDFNNLRYMYEATLMAVSENNDQEILYRNYSNAYKYILYLHRGFNQEQIEQQIDSYELNELIDKFYALKRA